MSVHQIPTHHDALDLLRRFAPTLFKVSVHLGFATVALETNDLSLVPPSSPDDLSTFAPPSCLWKIIRDVDAWQQLMEATIVLTDNLIVYSMGPACLIAADRDRKEVLAFIGTEADAHAFQESILPALCRLTKFVTGPPSVAPASATKPLAVTDECNA
jgi:hypothetical protein